MYFPHLSQLRSARFLHFCAVFAVCFVAFVTALSGVRVSSSLASSGSPATVEQLVLVADGVEHVVPLADRPSWFREVTTYRIAGLDISFAGLAPLPGGTTEMRLSTAELYRFAQGELAPLVSRPAGVLQISTDDADVPTGTGSAWDGRELDVLALVEGMRVALATGDGRVELPFRTQQPQLQVDDALQARGFTEIIGSTEMIYPGSSADRSHNVTAGAHKISGSVVAAGAEWSFNDSLFPLFKSEFREENVIIGGELVKELGGGVCQVSSAVFRAVLDAGLPVVEQHPHSMRLRHYHPPGLDAAVYPGIKDFRFANDTAHDIFVFAETQGEAIRVTIVGTPDGRQAEIAGPFLADGSDLPADADPGLEFLWTRALDGEVEEYRARYWRIQ